MSEKQKQPLDREAQDQYLMNLAKTWTGDEIKWPEPPVKLHSTDAETASLIQLAKTWAENPLPESETASLIQLAKTWAENPLPEAIAEDLQARERADPVQMAKQQGATNWYGTQPAPQPEDEPPALVEREQHKSEGESRLAQVWAEQSEQSEQRGEGEAQPARGDGTVC